MTMPKTAEGKDHNEKQEIKKLLEMKTYYLNFRNTLDCINSRLDTAERNISELEERNRNNSTCSTESETKRPVLQ